MVEVSNKIDLDQISLRFESSLSNGGESVITADYILAFREINKIFNRLGSIFSFVEEDVDSKCTILERHREGTNGRCYETILSMVNFEIAHGLITAKDIKLENGFNKNKTKAITPSAPTTLGSNNVGSTGACANRIPDPSCDDLPSGSRSLLRLHRSMKFIILLFPTLLNSDPNQSSSIRDGVRKLYDDTLAKFHPWIVRKAVHLALFAACPSREKLLSLVDYDGSMDDLRLKCEGLCKSGEKVMENVHKIYERNGILDLP